MTRLARRTSLLSAFYLLTSVATAYAECAWVLWWKCNGYSYCENWEPKQAFTSLTECDRTARVQTTTAQTAREHGISDWDARCLPDTVDPRGPKGK